MTNPGDAWSWIVQGGAVGALFLLLMALRQGWLRTQQEVEALRGRVDRAEGQVDTLLPALARLTDSIEKMMDLNRAGGQ